ncbi:MAG: nucleoside-diphosphate kinase [Deltaproteobacteria bacterium]|nr:nucleoside-diphosphate kinase [Candidatus Tharpella aukensis]
MIEKTLSIIKPDAVAKGVIGQIITCFSDNDLKIAALKMIHLSKREAQGFYAVHAERPFFDSLTDFMTSGPVVIMVLNGENAISKNRELMGATNPAEAADGTLRKRFATDIEKNAVHGSDAPETAREEIGYFFPELEIVNS